MLHLYIYVKHTWINLVGLSESKRDINIESSQAAKQSPQV